jgi:ATP-binding cassette, subfamily C, bacterial CydC
MDQIIVMENEKLIEPGSFDELMEHQGYFFELKQLEKSVLMLLRGETIMVWLLF